MISVMGATGHTGKGAAERLLDKGAKVRVLSRSADHVAPFTQRGAEAAVAVATDAGALTRAFRGAEAVYAMVPPDLQSNDPLGHYRTVGEAVAKALEAAGVKRVVLLSSLGAELPSGTGPIAGLYLVEERLRKIPGINLLILRPGYFMENHFGSLGLIRAQRMNGGGLAPDVPFAQIATHDIGVAAADALLAGTFKGVTVRELLGPRNLSMVEATRIIGQRIDKPDLKYVQFPDDAFRAGLIQAGLSKALADLFVEMCHAINTGKVRSLEGRNLNNTTPTTFESFAETLAQAWRAQGAGSASK
jgi:uncharacterized protein YbjT (DUF2867 family)